MAKLLHLYRVHRRNIHPMHPTSIIREICCTFSQFDIPKKPATQFIYSMNKANIIVESPNVQFIRISENKYIDLSEGSSKPLDERTQLSYFNLDRSKIDI